MEDLTILFLTLHKLPAKWQAFHKDVLRTAVGDTKLIEPTQTEAPSPSAVYRKMLTGALEATTEYVAIAEDDTLYPEEHFLYRPKPGVFAYNQSHWSLFTWDEPTYSWRDRLGNYTLIAHRTDVIDALTERFTKYPNGTPPEYTGEIGRWRTDAQLGLSKRNVEEFKTSALVRG